MVMAPFDTNRLTAAQPALGPSKPSTGLANLVPPWQKLGWPSAEAWTAAGSPQVQYSSWQSQQEKVGPGTATAVSKPTTFGSLLAGERPTPAPQPAYTPQGPSLEYEPQYASPAMPAGASELVTAPQDTLRAQLQEQRQGATFDPLAAPLQALSQEAGQQLGTALQAPFQAMEAGFGAIGVESRGAQMAGNVAQDVGQAIPPLILPQSGPGLIGEVALGPLGIFGDAATVARAGVRGLAREGLEELPQGAASALVRGTPVDEGLLAGPGFGRPVPAPRPGIAGGAPDEGASIGPMRDPRFKYQAMRATPKLDTAPDKPVLGWVDPEGQTWQMQRGLDHEAAVDESALVMSTRSEEAFDNVFRDGWVRVVREPNAISVNGLDASSVNRAINRIMDTLSPAEMRRTTLYVDAPGIPRGSSYSIERWLAENPLGDGPSPSGGVGAQPRPPSTPPDEAATLGQPPPAGAVGETSSGVTPSMAPAPEEDDLYAQLMASVRMLEENPTAAREAFTENVEATARGIADEGTARSAAYRESNRAVNARAEQAALLSGEDTATLRRRAQSRTTTTLNDLVRRMNDETGSIRMPGGGPKPPPAPTQGALTDVGTGRVPEQFMTPDQRYPHTIRGRVGGFAADVARETSGVIGAPLALKTTISPMILRQGMTRLITNPAAALRETSESVLRAARETDARTFQQSLLDNPWSSPVSSKGSVSPFKGFTASDVDLKVRDWGTAASAESRAPEFQGIADSRIGRLTQKLPHVRFSDRQYALEFNAHALNRYAEVAQRMFDAGERDIEAYRDLARVIEHQLHYGSWQQGKIPVFFSTRAISGRAQTITDLTRFNPADALKPGAAREAWKGAIGMVAGNLAVMYAVAEALPGFDIQEGIPPKLKTPVGTIDPWAGWGTIARLVYDVGTIIEDVGADGNIDELGPKVTERVVRFLRGQESPVASKLTDIGTGEDWKGDPFSITQDVTSGNILADMAAPMLAESMLEGYKNYGPAGAAAAGGVEGLSGSLNQSVSDYMRADQVSRRKYDMDYFDLPPFAQAEVNAELEQAGRPVEDKVRAGPYNYASNGALKVVQQRLAGDAEFRTGEQGFLSGLGMQDFNLADYETMGKAHTAWTEMAQANGASRMQAEGAWEDYTSGLGIPKITRQMREDAIAADPKIVDALITMFEAGESEYPPPQWALEVVGR